MIQRLALAAAVAFPIAMGLKAKGHPRAGEIIGVIFHILLFPVVASLDAPEWVRAIGYGWLLLDTAIGGALVNDLDKDLAWKLRLGGHILAGLWIFCISLRQSYFLFLTGLSLSLCLGGYSFVAFRAHRRYLIPSGILMVAWLTEIALQK